VQLINVPATVLRIHFLSAEYRSPFRGLGQRNILNIPVFVLRIGFLSAESKSPFRGLGQN
jgi:hypothetical protein